MEAKIAEFMNVTGSEDMDYAEDMLRPVGYDVANAIMNHFALVNGEGSLLLFVTLISSHASHPTDD